MPNRKLTAIIESGKANDDCKTIYANIEGIVDEQGTINFEKREGTLAMAFTNYMPAFEEKFSEVVGAVIKTKETNKDKYYKIILSLDYNKTD